MAISGAKRRQQLFDLYSTNIGFYCPDLAGQFVCPICFRAFTRDAIESETLEVDIAHVYPGACGGKAETLTCKQCNSRMGAMYDRLIVREHKAHGALSEGSGYVPSRLRFANGKSVGVEWKRSGDGFHIKVIGKQTNPREEEELKTELMKGPGAGFTIGFPWFNQRWHNAAMLHSTHLALFRQYGYEYAFYAQTQWVRDILLAEEPPQELKIPAMEVPKEVPLTSDEFYAAGIADAVGIGRFLMVMLPTPTPKASCRIILMPGIGNRAGEEYQALLDHGEAKVPLRYRFAYGSIKERLSNERGVGWLHKVWRLRTGAVHEDDR